MISIRHFSICCLVLLACFGLSNGLTHSSLSHPPPFVPADLAKAEALNPGDQVPSFSVPTINNGGTFNYHAMPANASAFKQVNPVLIHAWNSQSAFYNAMWTYDEYIDDLLQRSPNATQYLFLSWSNNLYLEEAHYMQSRIQERMSSLNFTSSRKQQFNQRIYYGAVPVSKLTGPASFIPSLLTNWTDVLNQFFIYNSSQNAAERLNHRPLAFSSNQEKSWIAEPFAKAPSTPARRLDGRWPWVMSMTSVFGNSSIPIAWFGDGCGNSTMPSSLGSQNPLPIQNVTGKLALILRAHANESGQCSYFRKIHNAQKSGAVGAVIVSDEGEPLIDVNCNGDNCDALMEIPATMITWTAGQNIYQLLTTSKPQLMFQDTTSAGFHFALDAESRVQEVGWFQYPSMAFIAWEAQWFEYYERLLQKIETVQSPDSSLTIPIYQQVVMSGPAYVNVSIPQGGTEGLGQWAGAYLDLQLGCPGPKDSSCPAWDRILGLFVCCNYTSGESFTNSSATCGQEIGRWITPFGRRVGRWLTEITPLLPLLSNNGTLMPSGPKEMQCTFQINCGTTENWVPTVNLILSSEANPNDYLQKAEDSWTPLSKKKAANKLIPFQIVPLYEGGTFDQTYNNRTPIVFTPSNGTVKVELVSVITGHGSDNHNCAEFCITSHHFEFNNDTTFSRTFHNAGDELGCADKVPDGVLPNEYGTWLYGRDGWCDGQEVKPWVVDVTNVISLTKANTVLYWGYYDGHTPDPTENPGYIDLHSYLVYYKSG